MTFVIVLQLFYRFSYIFKFIINLVKSVFKILKFHRTTKYVETWVLLLALHDL
jgi:hypothetical protein